jgi:3',5'-cyclic AMP phosphodiesterase CpdA
VFTLLFITDLHIGHPGNARAFHLQPVSQHLEWHASRLRRCVQSTRPQLVVFGGDLAHDSRDPALIQAAMQMMGSIPAPVVAVLGNHDLMHRGPEDWSAIAAPSNVELVRSVAIRGHSECDLIALTHPWRTAAMEAEAAGPAANRAAFRWDTKLLPIPAILAEQLDQLRDALTSDQRKPAILVTHAPIGIYAPDDGPPTGAAAVAYHEYEQALLALAREFPRLVLILSGHVHYNCANLRTQVPCLTTAAFNELPCCARRIIVTDDRSVKAQLLALADGVNDFDLALGSARARRYGGGN